MNRIQRALMSAKELQAKASLASMLDDLFVFRAGRLFGKTEILVNMTSKKAWRKFAMPGFPFNELQPDVIKVKKFASSRELSAALEGFSVVDELGYLGDIETAYIDGLKKNQKQGQAA